MAAKTGSRYDSVVDPSKNNPTDYKAGGTTNGTTNTNGTSNTSGTTTNTTTNNSTTVTHNLDDANLAVLNKLIQQLLSGGTPEMKQQQGVRNDEINNVRGIRAGYSKEAAFADAQGLINQQLRRALEAAMPAISRAAEDAGSSGGALRALLLQDASQRAAESASAAGIQAAGTYGNISANLSAVLENLTRVNPEATKALIDALNIAKGATTTTDTTGTTTGVQNTNTVTTNNQNTNTKDNKTEYKDYLPFENTPPPAPLTYGSSADVPFSNDVLSRTSTLNALASMLAGDNNWGNYEF